MQKIARQSHEYIRRDEKKPMRPPMRVSGRRNISTWPIRPGVKRSKGLNAATRIVTRMKGNVPVTTAPRTSPVSHP